MYNRLLEVQDSANPLTKHFCPRIVWSLPLWAGPPNADAKMIEVQARRRCLGMGFGSIARSTRAPHALRTLGASVAERQ